MNRIVLVSSCVCALLLIFLALAFPPQTGAQEPEKTTTTATASRTFKVEPAGKEQFPGCIKEIKEEKAEAETTTSAKKDEAGTTKTASTASETMRSVKYECVQGCTYNVYAADATGNAKLRIANDECKVLNVPRGGDRDQIEANCRAAKQCIVQSCVITEKCTNQTRPGTCAEVESCKVVAGSKLDAALEEAGVSGSKPPASDALKLETEEKQERIKLLEEQNDALKVAWGIYEENKEACETPPCTAVVPEPIVKKLGLYTEGCKDGECPMKLERMQQQLEEKQITLNEDIARSKGGLEIPLPRPNPLREDGTSSNNNNNNNTNNSNQLPPSGPYTSSPGPQYPGQPTTFSGQQGRSGGGLGNLGSILGVAGRVLSGLFGGQQCPQQQQEAQACPTDPQVYQQYQQWYQQQIQQYQYRMQLYQQQRQMDAYQRKTTTACPPQPPVPCQPGGTGSGSGTGGSQCHTPPPVPNSICTAGWRPVYTGTCVTDWTCRDTPDSPSDSPNSPVPSAQISCQPKLADVGTTIAISFSCSAGTAKGTGFETEDKQSGSATAVIEDPARGVKTAEFGLTCTDDGRSASRVCGVKINKPVIVFVSNPKQVAPGETATVGWVTAGMESCVVSSPDLPVFTEEYKGRPKKDGVAQTPALTETATFVLECVTLGGGTKRAEEVITVGSDQAS